MRMKKSSENIGIEMNLSVHVTYEKNKRKIEKA